MTQSTGHQLASGLHSGGVTRDTRARVAAAALALVLVGAAVEVGLTLVATRDAPSPGDWDVLAQEVAAAAADEPVYLAQTWLGPTARMHVPALASIPAVASPDLRGSARFHVVGWDRIWGPELQHDLEDLSPPRLVERRQVGSWQWATYAHVAAFEVTEDLLAAFDALAVFADGHRCRGRGQVRCNAGTVGPHLVEIDYRPRHCLALSVRDDTTVKIAHDHFLAGDVLQGHVGFADFNARLRNDAPIDLSVRIDGDLRAHWTVSDNQGWWPFAVETTAGEQRLELEILVAQSGSYQPQGYDPTPTRQVCVEVRGLRRLE